MNVSQIGTRSADAISLRVMTYNVFGTQGGWEQRRPVLINGLRNLAPDLIALHETLVTDSYDQVGDLLGADYHIVHSRERGPDGVGWSTASRWPIAWSEELDLNVTPRTSDFPCTTIISEIEVPDAFAPMLFVNHIPSWQLHFEHERLLQAVVAVRRIEEIIAEREMHVVFVGDLDAEPDAASMRFLTGKQPEDNLSVCYRNAWESVHPGKRGETFSQRNALMSRANWDWPHRQIDHILVRCALHGGPSLKVDACELAFDEPIDGVWGSDHFAVVADLSNPGGTRQ